LLGEYAAWDLADLENFARSVELFPNMSSMMKVEREPRLWIAQRSLGAGIQNLLFADCDSAREVEECIRFIRPSTPQDGGLHGGSMRRNTGYGLESASAGWAQAMRDTIVDIMIESEKAFANLDEILAVRGVDMVHFGPSDYSLSVGRIGESGSAAMRQIHGQVIQKALNKGVRPRVVINELSEAEEFWEMGVRDFCLGSDLGVIYRWCSSNGEKMRQLLQKPET
jgi:2-keto-3-deoxy-L-rhamnonate aldolase RhmA